MKKDRPGFGGGSFGGTVDGEESAIRFGAKAHLAEGPLDPACVRGEGDTQGVVLEKAVGLGGEAGSSGNPLRKGIAKAAGKLLFFGGKKFGKIKRGTGGEKEGEEDETV